MSRKVIFILTIFTVSFSLFACQSGESSQSQEGFEQEAIETNARKAALQVPLMTGEGLQVATVTLSERADGGDGVRLVIEGDNLPPGEHGFHIHDVGQCIPPDFESAGSHYNPTNSKHGFDHPEGPHAGDLENIIVNDDGTVYQELDAPMVSLKRDSDQTLFTDAGTSLIIHSDPDDYMTQPTGNAGARIACGVIGE